MNLVCTLLVLAPAYMCDFACVCVFVVLLFTVAVSTVRVHMWAPATVKGTLTISGGWAGPASTASSDVLVPAGDSNVTMEIVAEATNIRLWWPVGLGDHPLFNVTASFLPSGAYCLHIPLLACNHGHSAIHFCAK